MIEIYNENCIEGCQKYIERKSIDLLICDPPFGINEADFQKHYKRNSDFVVNGYNEAPENYQQFCLDWISAAKRILKDNGSFYIVSGYSNLQAILNALEYNNFELINHIIWKYNFGVYTKKKFVSSHYHILYVCKHGAKPKFNTYCRFGPQEKNQQNGSLLYQDLEDVWMINKEFQPNTNKNVNKLPDELIRKMILYSSDKDEIVCDFFLGNFTTAYVARELGRKFIGFELNKHIFDCHAEKVKTISYGSGLNNLKNVEILFPENQGKKITESEKQLIYRDYCELRKSYNIKSAKEFLSAKYGRGKFSIHNIIEKEEKQLENNNV